ncbi:acetyl-CoA C-acyltransferase, partial [Listeria monocytogenes]|nr:acetyl-CoA C-acyltransferase [Listeria monocytogenes]
EKLDLDPALLEDVVMGCAYPEAEQGMNIARIASFRAGFPQSLGGATLNRFCGSSMSAVHYAAGQVLLGAGEAFIAAGVE